MAEPTAIARWGQLVAPLNSTVPISMVGAPVVGVPGMREDSQDIDAFHVECPCGWSRSFGGRHD